ncbi:CaiB/BaiF CoA-transferase family protein [uncultured Tateyamaria sp.]|uniref:CaiB/BaiF CoA transferase family protein n=1 Tax=uncultured Tateyamaria sp. TaxID=455651 RepID=UPI002625BA77|nr:CaiB/BaiF CoA-transferase family protein [uncultured Tateyamaria sp.]
MTGPLATLKVVEFAGLGPAPLAGQMLADMGADVVVIDRASGPADSNDVNRRGKRSIALNLKSEDGRATAQALMAQADIVIEGFRPGVMERLGLGPDDCPAHVIYGRMTGWGQTGPLAQAAGHDITYLATTGALSMMGPADGPPEPPMNLVADYGGGTMFLLFGLLSAVIERAVSGQGQVVDAAMVDGVPAMMGLIHGMISQDDWTATRGTNWLDGGAPFYRCYVCADGQYVAVGALEPQFYALLIEGLGLAEAELPDQNDRASWPEMQARFASIFVTRDRDAWTAVFASKDACVAPVLSLKEAVAHPHLAERGTYVKPGEVTQAAPAPRFSRSISSAPVAPTAPGADTAAILGDLGYDAAAQGALRAKGALS